MTTIDTIINTFRMAMFSYLQKHMPSSAPNLIEPNMITLLDGNIGVMKFSHTSGYQINGLSCDNHIVVSISSVFHEKDGFVFMCSIDEFEIDSVVRIIDHIKILRNLKNMDSSLEDYGFIGLLNDWKENKVKT